MGKVSSHHNSLYVDPRQARLMGHQMGITGANRQELRLMKSHARKAAKKNKGNKSIFSNYFEAVAQCERRHKQQPPEEGFIWIVAEENSYRYVVKLVELSEIECN